MLNVPTNVSAVDKQMHSWKLPRRWGEWGGGSMQRRRIRWGAEEQKEKGEEQSVGREGRRGEGDDGDTCRFVSSWRVKCTHSPLFCPHIFSLSLCIGSHPPSIPLPHPLTPFIPTYYWSLKKKIGQPLCKEERRSGEGGRLWAEGKKQGETKHSG